MQKLLMQLNNLKSNKLFFTAVFISASLHIPLYSYLNHYYFLATKRTNKVIRKNTSDFIYIPTERNVRIEKISLAKNTNMTRKTVKAIVAKKKYIVKTKSSSKTKKTFENKKNKKFNLLKKNNSFVLTEDINLNNNDLRETFMNYYEILSSMIGSFAVYPHIAKENGTEGICYVSFVLLENGKLKQVEIIQTSGNKDLDIAAVNAVSNAAPFPPIPKKFNKKEMRLNVPISFELNE